MGRELFLGLVVFLGAGLGGVLRHAVNRLLPLVLNLHFPAATLVVNLVGSLIMGLLAGWFAFRGEQAGQTARLFLTTGVLGGFTTFSTFSLDIAVLWERGASHLALAYLAASILGGLLAVFAGLALSRAILG